MSKKVNLMLIISSILVVAMVSIIFAFSTQQGDISTGTSKEILDTLIEKLGIQSYIEKNEWIYEHRNLIFRKILHFCEYAILATLVFITLRVGKVKLKYIPAITILFAFAVAALDEYYQSHIPGRSPKIRDVFIDTMGAVAAIIFILLKIKMFRRIKKDEAY